MQPLMNTDEHGREETKLRMNKTRRNEQKWKTAAIADGDHFPHFESHAFDP